MKWNCVDQYIVKELSLCIYMSSCYKIRDSVTDLGSSSGNRQHCCWSRLSYTDSLLRSTHKSDTSFSLLLSTWHTKTHIVITWHPPPNKSKLSVKSLTCKHSFLLAFHPFRCLKNICGIIVKIALMSYKITIFWKIPNMEAYISKQRISWHVMMIRLTCCLQLLSGYRWLPIVQRWFL